MVLKFSQLNPSKLVISGLSTFKLSVFKGGLVELDWITSSETDNSHFVIERSQDGVEFIAIGKVNGAGTTYSKQEYLFVDRNPYPGLSYYRLRQVDHNGSFTYSDIRIIRLENDRPKSLVFPNPVQDELFIEMNEPVISISVYDNMGLKVWHAKDADRVNYDVSNLSPGIYRLVISTKKQVHFHSLIKH